jgi:hypothetical protein
VNEFFCCFTVTGHRYFKLLFAFQKDLLVYTPFAPKERSMSPARSSDDIVRAARAKKQKTAQVCATRAATKLIKLVPVECRGKLSVESLAELIVGGF